MGANAPRRVARCTPTLHTAYRQAGAQDDVSVALRVM